MDNLLKKKIPISGIDGINNDLSRKQQKEKLGRSHIFVTGLFRCLKKLLLFVNNKISPPCL